MSPTEVQFDLLGAVQPTTEGGTNSAIYEYSSGGLTDIDISQLSSSAAAALGADNAVQVSIELTVQLSSVSDVQVGLNGPAGFLVEITVPSS